MQFSRENGELLTSFNDMARDTFEDLLSDHPFAMYSMSICVILNPFFATTRITVKLGIPIASVMAMTKATIEDTSVHVINYYKYLIAHFRYIWFKGSSDKQAEGIP